MKYVSKIAVLLSAIFTIASCNKEDNRMEPPTQIEPPTQLVHLNITSLIEDSEARSAHVVTANGSTGGFILADKPLNIRIAVRRGNGTPIYSTLKFDRVTNRQAVRYEGQVKVPQGTGNDFQISAIVLNEVGGRTYSTLTSDNKVEAIPVNNFVLPSSGKVITQIPYIANWTPMSLSADGRVLERVLLRFKPSGTLLRINIENDDDKAIVLKSIKIKTDAFVDNWAYDFTQLGTVGAFLEGESTSTGLEKVYQLPAIEQIEINKKSKWYYLWVMPKRPTSGTTLTTQFTLVTNTDEEINIHPKEGELPAGTVPVTLKLSYASKTPAMVPDDISKSCFPDRKLPIEYVAHYNVNEDGTGFDETLKNNSCGFFTWDDAKARFAQGVTIEGKTYYLPTQQQMRAILPIKHMNFATYPKRISVEKELIQAGGQSYTTSADYSRPNKNQILYALRLKHDTKCLQTAYRYEFVGDFVSGNLTSHLKVTCRYLGKSYPWTIDDIDNEEFWSQGTENDIVRYFPASKERGFGSNGSYWTSTAIDPTIPPGDTRSADDYYFQKYAGAMEMGGSKSTKTFKFSVRLFGREVVTPAYIVKPM